MERATLADVVHASGAVVVRRVAALRMRQARTLLGADMKQPAEHIEIGVDRPTCPVCGWDVMALTVYCRTCEAKRSARSKRFPIVPLVRIEPLDDDIPF
jgi:hypothetical protein